MLAQDRRCPRKNLSLWDSLDISERSKNPAAGHANTCLSVNLSTTDPCNDFLNVPGAQTGVAISEVARATPSVHFPNCPQPYEILYEEIGIATILNYISSLKSTTPWMKETKKDMRHADITDTSNKNTFRNKVNKWEVKPEQPKSKPYRPKWSEERKLAFSNRMKEYWKIKNSKKLIRTPQKRVNLCLTFSIIGKIR
ncbi:hypothetical protein R5R35_008137 [Gryllus longicercus]|uniref:Uncharacterized protein n=1 Tax=Gryllus longicercus TaxID=2509291 RepID=A0AAN9VB03_9ORTH